MTRRASLLAYLLLIGGGLLILAAILGAGAELHAPAEGAVAAATPATRTGGTPMPDLPLLILQIGVIVGVARLAGALVRRIGQPQVVGEMLAGLLLGPSLLGWAAPALSAAVFPAGSLGFLSALSQVGLLVFMFLVGLELDPAHLRERGHAAVLTSHASIVVPFVLGAAVAIPLYPRMGDPAVPFTSFALFLGAAMSVTAFPVLARILSERGLLRTRLGAVAITAAAVDDVTAWCILAAVLAVARAAGHPEVPLWMTIAGSVAWAAFVLTAGRALLARLGAAAERRGRLTQSMLALVVLAVFASAWVTERLGVHALFGAFLVGAAMPRTPWLVRALLERFEDVMTVLLLPLFFAFTGLRTRLGLIAGAEAWAFCALVLVVAVAGKLGGSAVAARATGMRWREALSLGALMNTRGLMELVILNVGLDAGVLTPPVYAMMVLMALATTAMTSPLLSWLRPAGLDGPAEETPSMPPGAPRARAETR